MERTGVIEKHRLPQAVKARLPEFTKTNILISIGTALAFFSVLVVNACMIGVVLHGAWAYPLVALLSVRSLRALENLGGHEGAHKNWFRKNSRLNDLWANIFAGYWVITSAQSFGKIHGGHHSGFGAPPDPCFTRYSMFRFAQMKGNGSARFFKALLGEYIPYIRDYWMTYAHVKHSEFAFGVLMHLGAMMAGTYVKPRFWIGWLLAVVVPFVFILPIFRMWAEAEEHDYDGKPEFYDTYNNLSIFSRFFLHPAGDAYHLMHHIIPVVPHFRARYVHLRLLELDPEYRNAQKVRK